MIARRCLLRTFAMRTSHSTVPFSDPAASAIGRQEKSRPATWLPVSRITDRLTQAFFLKIQIWYMAPDCLCFREVSAPVLPIAQTLPISSIDLPDNGLGIYSNHYQSPMTLTRFSRVQRNLLKLASIYIGAHKNLQSTLYTTVLASTCARFHRNCQQTRNRRSKIDRLESGMDSSTCSPVLHEIQNQLIIMSKPLNCVRSGDILGMTIQKEMGCVNFVLSSSATCL